MPKNGLKKLMKPPLLPPDVAGRLGRLGGLNGGVDDGGGRGRNMTPLPPSPLLNPPPKSKLPVSSIELSSGKVMVGVGGGVMGRKPPVFTGLVVVGRITVLTGLTGTGLTGTGFTGRFTGTIGLPPPPLSEQRPG